MNNIDKEYFRLTSLVLSKGRRKSNRTGIDTIGIFGEQAKFDLTEGFPLLTTKKIFYKGIIHELLWFLSGSTNIKYLIDNDVHIWDEWAYVRYKKSSFPKPCITEKQFCDNIIQEDFISRIKSDKEFSKQWGELGEGTYGGMWRDFPSDAKENNVHILGVDQITTLINKLKINPDDRRLIVSAWHPYWSEKCALAPCHCLFQFHTEELTIKERLDIYHKGVYRLLPKYLGKDDEQANKNLDDIEVPKRRLNCQLYQRSCDLFLGVPFNIASYALLIHLIAHEVNMAVGTFIHTYGDLHIYTNHLNQIKLQMGREPYPDLPTIVLNPYRKNVLDFVYNDINITGYKCHTAIKGEVAV